MHATLRQAIRAAVIRDSGSTLLVVGGLAWFGCLLGSSLLLFGVASSASSSLPSAGWSFRELAALAAVAQFGFSAGEAFFLGIWLMAPTIYRTGLEHVLVRPAHPLLSIICERLSIQSMQGAIVSMAMLVVLRSTGLTMSLLGTACGSIIFVIGMLALYAFYFCLGTTAFWLGRNDAFRRLAIDLQSRAGNMPLSLFPRSARMLLSAIPLLWVALVPTEFLLGRGSPARFASALLSVSCLLAFWSWLGGRLWAAGLKRYQGVGG